MVKIVYDFKSKNDDIIVEADRVRLSQVIRNLVDNAIKFTVCITINKQYLLL